MICIRSFIHNPPSSQEAWKIIQTLPKPIRIAVPLRCLVPAAVMPAWGPALPTALASSMLAAWVSNHCCWQDFDDLSEHRGGTKLKWLKPSPAVSWLQVTLTSFRNVQLIQDADGWWERCQGWLSLYFSKCPPCSDRGALSKQNSAQVPVKTSCLHLIIHPVCLSCALSNLSTFILFLPFLFQEWMYPRGDYS